MDLHKNGLDSSTIRGPIEDKSPIQTRVVLKYLRHTLRSLDKWNPSTKRIPEDTHINEDLLYKEISCSSRLG